VAKEKDDETDKAEELDRVIDDVLRTSRAMVQQLEDMLERARALIKENKRLLADRKRDKDPG